MSVKKTFLEALQNTTHSGPTNPIKNREHEMIPNNGGGFGFKLSDEQYITRVLILGTPSTYYVGGKKNTTDAINKIKSMIGEGKQDIIFKCVKSIYEEGRAPKQEPLLMILALLARHDNLEVRRRAFEIVKIFRTLSQLYSFLNFYKTAGTTKGWADYQKMLFVVGSRIKKVRN